MKQWQADLLACRQGKISDSSQSLKDLSDLSLLRDGEAGVFNNPQSLVEGCSQEVSDLQHFQLSA